MWWDFKDFVNYSQPYGFLQFTKSLSRSLETSPNVSILNWVTRVTQKELKQVVYLTKGAWWWWGFKDFVNYSQPYGFL